MARTFQKLLSQDFNLGTGADTKKAPGGGDVTGTQVGIHTFAVGMKAETVAWAPGSIAAGSKASKEITVSGAALGDFVLRSFSLDVADLSLTADVTAEDTVTAVLANLTGAAVNPGSGTLSVLVLKSR